MTANTDSNMCNSLTAQCFRPRKTILYGATGIRVKPRALSPAAVPSSTIEGGNLNVARKALAKL